MEAKQTLSIVSLKLSEEARLSLSQLSYGTILSYRELSDRSQGEISSSTIGNWLRRDRATAAEEFDHAIVVDRKLENAINNWYPKPNAQKAKPKAQAKPEPVGNPGSLVALADDMLDLAARMEEAARVLTAVDQIRRKLLEL